MTAAGSITGSAGTVVVVAFAVPGGTTTRSRVVRPLMVSTTVDASGTGGRGTSPSRAQGVSGESHRLGDGRPEQSCVSWGGNFDGPHQVDRQGVEPLQLSCELRVGVKKRCPEGRGELGSHGDLVEVVLGHHHPWSEHGKISLDKARASPAAEPVAIGAVPPASGVQTRCGGEVVTGVGASVVDVVLDVVVVATEIVSVGVSPTTTLHAARAHRSRRNTCFMGGNRGQGTDVWFQSRRRACQTKPRDTRAAPMTQTLRGT